MSKIKTLYTFRGDDKSLTCAKLDKDLGVIETYAIIENRETGEVTCTCPSRYVPCKHMKLLKSIRQHFPDDLQTKYWYVGPKGVDIQGFTADEISDLFADGD